MTNTVQLGSIDMETTEYVVKATRRLNAEAPINLNRRRNWYDGEGDTTKTTEATKTVPETNADTGKDKTGENTKTVQMSQADLDRLMADRAGQAKRNALSDLLKDLDVQDVTALKAIAESHKQAEGKRIADEEAQKTELEKIETKLSDSVSLYEQSIVTNRELLIRLAITERAPGKGIDPIHFRDLQTLMINKDSITITDGVVDDKTVDAAIDATLEGRDYLKVSAQNGKRPGSPPSKKMLPTQQQQPQNQQPVKKKYGGI